jgi:mono/diheme cytochrome c family protein
MPSFLVDLNGAGRHSQQTTHIPKPVWAALALVLLSVTIGGCYNKTTGAASAVGINFTLPAFPNTGSYAVEVFTEMHYQPSYGVQEIPRLLPPVDSVPVTGKEISYATMEEYQALTVPDRSAQSYDPASAQHLYQINCMVCHGEDLRGDGRIVQYIKSGPLPADLTLGITQDASDGELYAFISGGGRQGIASRLRGQVSRSPMPEFRLLLTEEERWTLVQLLRSAGP